MNETVVLIIMCCLSFLCGFFAGRGCLHGRRKSGTDSDNGQSGDIEQRAGDNNQKLADSERETSDTVREQAENIGRADEINKSAADLIRKGKEILKKKDMDIFDNQ